MAAKKPIVISDIPVLREILDDNSAVFCDHSKVQDWVDGIRRIKNDKEFAEKISSNSYRLFKKKYTWKSRAKRLISLCN